MKGFFKKTTAAVTLNSSSASGGNTIPSALAKATANSTQPLQQQEMLFLLGASVREPPSMAAAWMERWAGRRGRAAREARSRAVARLRPL